MTEPKICHCSMTGEVYILDATEVGCELCEGGAEITTEVIKRAINFLNTRVKEVKKEVDLTGIVGPNEPKDFSWFLVAVDRKGEAWILDGAEDLFKYDVLIEPCASDNGVAVPAGLAVAMYKVTKVKIRTGGMDGDITEISGHWTQIAMQAYSKDEI